VIGPGVWAVFGLLLGVVWGLPNTQQLMDAWHEPRPERSRGLDLAWRPSAGWALVVALMGVVAIVGMVQAQEFVYFRF
jgi:hypothetical protein